MVDIHYPLELRPEQRGLQRHTSHLHNMYSTRGRCTEHTLAHAIARSFHLYRSIRSIPRMALPALMSSAFADFERMLSIIMCNCTHTSTRCAVSCSGRTAHETSTQHNGIEGVAAWAYCGWRADASNAHRYREFGRAQRHGQSHQTNEHTQTLSHTHTVSRILRSHMSQHMYSRNTMQNVRQHAGTSVTVSPSLESHGRSTVRQQHSITCDALGHQHTTQTQTFAAQLVCTARQSNSRTHTPAHTDTKAHSRTASACDRVKSINFGWYRDGAGELSE